MSTNDKKNGFAITIGGTEMTLDIGKEDLLAVAVANYEQGLLAKRKDLTIAIRETSKERDDALAEAEKIRTELAQAVDRKKADSFVRAAKRIGLKIEVSDRWDLDEKNAPNGFRAVREFVQEDRSGYRRPVIHCTETRIDDTAEIIALKAKVDSAEARLTELGEELRDVTCSLRNMSTKEREARAHLVIKGLQSTEEGRNLLAALASDGNPFMLTDGEVS